jgi:hypothetical protein
VLTPQNTNLQENVTQTVALIRDLNAVLTPLIKQPETAVDKSVQGSQAVMNDFRAGLLRISDGIADVAKQLSLPVEPQADKTGIMQAAPKTNILNAGDISLKPQDFMKYQSVMKDFLVRAGETVLIKSPQQAKAGLMPVTSSLPVDTESTIEALAFLKSRDIPPQQGFVDIMSRYFKNDMKLSGSVSQLNSAAAAFETAFKGYRPQATGGADGTGVNTAPVPGSTIKDIAQTLQDAKNIITDMSIKTGDRDLKAAVLETQLKAFIDKSGLNLENRLSIQADRRAEQLSNAGALKGQEAQAVSKDNLKSIVMKLVEQIKGIDSSKMSATQRESVKQVREAANDILTNLNALQFINHKPASFEMAYTQVPVFFNNKIFNGELQVWYRKGALKEDLRNNTPVNMVFMLNTSKLGAVKISMTVYKNEVECTVKAENEKAKQVLTRSKSEFLESLKGMKYNVKAFNVQLDEDGDTGTAPPPGDGYVNMGRINLQA